MSYAQTAPTTATTEDGRTLVLKDGSWVYADGASNHNNSCVPDVGFKEPKWISSKIRTRNKTRVGDLKNFASKDSGVEVDKIILIESNDTHANGTYVLCVNGKKMTYSRGGHIFRKGE